MTSAIKAFEERLQEQLTERNVPEHFGFEAILPFLMEILIQLFDSCFNKVPGEKVAKRMTDLGYIDKIRLGMRIKKKIFGNSRRNYNANNGPAMLDSLVKTSEDSTLEECKAFVAEMQDNPFPDDEIPGGWVF